MPLRATLLALLFSRALALEIPVNVRKFYDILQSKSGCKNKLASGFFNSKFERGDMSYCGDYLEDYGIVFLQGPGKLANMDVDCDGVQGGPEDDGRCDGFPTTVPETSVKSIIQEYNVGISDLNPYVHPFVVFGNSGDREGWKTFDPRGVGVEKASVMAVVCDNQMFYGILGDSNASDGQRPSVGEASLSLATACYGHGMNGGSGDHSSHDDPDVLYIAFTGSEAVLGPDGADWAADNFDDFHASLVRLGDRLVQRIASGGGDDCSWAGHCNGASCSVAQDCADDLTCLDGQCH